MPKAKLALTTGGAGSPQQATNKPAAVSEPAHSRRALLQLSALGVAGAAVLPAAAAITGNGYQIAPSVADPHLAWWAKLEIIDADYTGDSWHTDEQMSRDMDHAWGLLGLIAETPARTLDGAAVQIKAVIRACDEFDGPTSVERAGLGLALETIRRLSGRAAHG